MDEFFDISTWLTAIIGAVIVMAVYGRIARLARRSRQVPTPRPPAGGVRPVNHKATGRAVSPGHHEERPATPVALAAGEVRDRVTPRAPRPTPATTGVFISYRRQDTQHLAGRLYDRLRNHFGKERVFMDVDSIEPGLDFRRSDREGRPLNRCHAGANWRSMANQHRPEGAPPAGQPDDYVRLEIEATLNKPVRIIPVLVDDATMPSSKELPASLVPLSRRNAV